MGANNAKDCRRLQTIENRDGSLRLNALITWTAGQHLRGKGRHPEQFISLDAVYTLATLFAGLSVAGR